VHLAAKRAADRVRFVSASEWARAGLIAVINLSIVAPCVLQTRYDLSSMVQDVQICPGFSEKLSHLSAA
jgi:hypothetical protein